MSAHNVAPSSQCEALNFMPPGIFACFEGTQVPFLGISNLGISNLGISLQPGVNANQVCEQKGLSGDQVPLDEFTHVADFLGADVMRHRVRAEIRMETQVH